MNGEKFLLDTNAVIALLKGNEELLRHLKNASWIGVSIISKIEFLVFPDLDDGDKELFHQFLKQAQLIELSDIDELIRTTILLRRRYRFTLPDSIIAATAVLCDAILVSADAKLEKAEEFQVLNFS